MRDSFRNDVMSDLKLIGMSMMLVSVYCIFFMGSFSPVHFRSCAACVTLLCVMLSYTASSGLLFYFGFETVGIH